MRRLTALLLTGILTAGTIGGCGSSGALVSDDTAGVKAADGAAGEQTADDARDENAAEGAADGDIAENAGEFRTAVPGAELAAEEENAVKGAVFNIYCIGEDFKSRVQDYYPDYEPTGEDSGMIGETQVRWHLYNDAEEYRDDLDDMLEYQKEPVEEAVFGDTEEEAEFAEPYEETGAGDTEETTEYTEETAEYAGPDDKIDLFVVDEAYLRDYVESGYSLDVTAEVGINPDELADQFPYTQQMATDSEGRLKAVTWQATPGVFVYRRSIAREVLGTDNPDRVQEAVSDWEVFAETAELAKESGYYMLSGHGDAYQVYADNVSSAWVEDGVLNIDPHLTEWAEQAREFTQNGYTHGTEKWSDEWMADHTGDGEVFGFFDSSWGIRFTLQSKAEGDTGDEDGENDEDEDVTSATGDYAVCKGPEPSHYGGQWIIAAAGSDNVELAGSIMRTLTCNAELMKKITQEIHEFTNTVSGMTEIGQSDYKVDVLGRQNPVPVYVDVARELAQYHNTSYDEDLDLGFQISMQEYITGKTPLDEAVELFRKTALMRYGELEEE